MTPVPDTGRRSKVLLWVLFVLLVVALGTLAYLAVKEFSAPATRSSGEPPPPVTRPAWPEPFAGKYCYGGIPRPAVSFHDPITVLTNTGYLVGYSETKRDPVWVCYRLFKVGSLQAPPRPQGFQVDTRTQANVSQHDYTGSGYDRGHMAPNYAIAVCYGSQAQLETFLMSNIIPQRPQLNRQVWERLEQTEIRDYAQRDKQLWVIDGPVFRQGGKRLASGVAVPDSCFKILVEEGNGQPRILAFMMPQTVMGTESPAVFLTSVDAIEAATGLDFFAELPDVIEAKCEAETAKGMW